MKLSLVTSIFSAPCISLVVLLCIGVSFAIDHIMCPPAEQQAEELLFPDTSNCSNYNDCNYGSMTSIKPCDSSSLFSATLKQCAGSDIKDCEVEDTIQALNYSQ